MQEWRATALFLTIWVGLLTVITFLDLHNGFVFAAQPNAFLTFPAYWVAGGMIVLFCAMSLLPLWVWGYQPILRIALALGVGWLLALPFTPSTAEKALLLRGSRFHIGMTEAQVRAIMAGYKSFESGVACARDDACLAFCTGTCGDATVEVAFVSGRATDVQYAIED